MTSHIKQIHIKIFLILRLITVAYEKCALLCYYATSSGDSLSTFRDDLSAPSSKVKNPKRPNNPFLDSWPSKMGQIGCPETLVRNQSFFLNSRTLKDGTDSLTRNVGKKSNPFFFGFLTLEDGTDSLSWNVGKKSGLFYSRHLKDGIYSLSRNVRKKSNPFFGFLTLEDGTVSLSWNVDKKSGLFYSRHLKDRIDSLSRNVRKKSNLFFGFLTLEDGTDSLSWNVDNKSGLFILDTWKMGSIACPETSVRNPILFFILDPRRCDW
jgi:hypothetical protein